MVKFQLHGADCHSSHANVGYVPQQSEIDWAFPATVYDIVMMGRTRHSKWFPWWQTSDRDVVQTLLDQLSLSPLAGRQINNLSGGQKRRAFIARALAQEATVLMMDEPFNGVDTAAETEIMETLDVLTKQGITLLVATHDLGRAVRDFDRILLLNQRVLAYGTPDEVMQADTLQAAYGSSLRVLQDGNETIFITDEHGHRH